MTLSPWLSIVLLGVAIAGYAWMMPKQANRDKSSDKQGDAAYEQLLEDLEAENRELIDAVAKFKREQDETVDKLGRRIVDMEHQMKLWSLQTAAAAAPHAFVAQPSPAAVEPSLREPLPIPAAPVARPDVHVYHEQPAEPEPAIAEIDVSIRGRYQELLALHDKGRSIEQIAKTLGMNKGEVQLILQLARREEEQHA
ncbi:DUF6115 domain-containing protein [Cohnella sp. GCM10027633]|uniref:DUF6115 domain-containing protein n=1 Tax=unclassified Cohnella TaxID=2636738 RepID=UPI00363FB830